MGAASEKLHIFETFLKRQETQGLSSALYLKLAHHPGDGNADTLTNNHDLAAGDQLTICIDPAFVLMFGVKVDDSTTAHLEELPHRHVCTPEYDGDLNGDAVDGLIVHSFPMQESWLPQTPVRGVLRSLAFLPYHFLNQKTSHLQGT
jgi:hypothetical protein